MADGSAFPAVRTTCPYCGVGCGLSVAAGDGRSLSVAGDPAHPANHGRLCSKGLALGSTVGLEGRLLEPMIGDRPVAWDEAEAFVGQRFKAAIARHGPDSVAFYVSGQLLTEDYYAANKLMKGFIGSGNIDTNSRLCMASAVAGDCGVATADLDRFFDLVANAPRMVTLFSMGVNQSAHGTAKALSILNLHLATGRIGKPGACPFSITGQPNAMGGREVGGMANTLAAHMDFDEASRDRVARFWAAPRMTPGPGLKAVDMFEAIGDGRIKAVWILSLIHI